MGSILQEKCWLVTAFSERRSSEHPESHLALPGGRSSLEGDIGSTLHTTQVLPWQPQQRHTYSFLLRFMSEIFKAWLLPGGFWKKCFHLENSDFISG